MLGERVPLRPRAEGSRRRRGAAIVAPAALSGAAKNGKSVTTAADGDVKAHAQAALDRTRQSIKELTDAVAAKRNAKS